MEDTGPRRFRVPILVGSVFMVVAAFLPWWRAGGERVSGVELPATSGIGLEGPGLVDLRLRHPRPGPAGHRIRPRPMGVRA